MDYTRFGFKELYDVQLKATYPMEIGNRRISVGEPIAIFDSIQMSTFNPQTDTASAKGGYQNSSQVFWENTPYVDFTFTQGIFSTTHLALLANAVMETIATNIVPKIEDLETNEFSKVTLKETPLLDNFYIYDSITGLKIIDYTIEDKEVTLSDLAYHSIKIVYYFNYLDNSIKLSIGDRLITGFLELSGKTRLRDDKTGHESTGIIVMPKIQLMSDLSIRLGRDASPMQGNFLARGYPTGPKGRTRIADLILLSTDIDS